MTYNIVGPNGYGSITEHLQCLPVSAKLRAMTSDGCSVYIDGRKLNKTQLSALIKQRKEYDNGALS